MYLAPTLPPRDVEPPRRFAHHLLLPVLQTLSGDAGALTKACEALEKKHRYTAAQRLWHEAQYLAGFMDEDVFLRQPHRRWARTNLLALSPLRADIEGRRDDARAGYRAFLSSNEEHDLCGDLTVRQLAAWRQQELE